MVFVFFWGSNEPVASSTLQKPLATGRKTNKDWCHTRSSALSGHRRLFDLGRLGNLELLFGLVILLFSLAFLSLGLLQRRLRPPWLGQ